MGDRHREHSVLRATLHTARSLPKLPPPVLIPAVHPGPRRRQRDSPGYREKFPTFNISPGYSHQSRPRMYTTLAAPFHPVHPEFAPFPLLCFLHCTPARPRPLPPAHPALVPSTAESIGPGLQWGWAPHKLPSPLPQINVRVKSRFVYDFFFVPVLYSYHLREKKKEALERASVCAYS